MKKSPSSLNPEFDEANANILEELGESDDNCTGDLMCNKCGTLGFKRLGEKDGDLCLMTRNDGSVCPGAMKDIKQKMADGLMCETCGAIYPLDGHNKPGYYCVQETGGRGEKKTYCNGRIYLEKNVIKLPDSVKGKKDYKNGGSYTATWETHKHYGDKVIFEFESKKLYASNGHSLDEKSGKWDLIIDLAGVVPTLKTSQFIREDTPKRFKELRKYLDKDEELPSEVMRLFWTDMSVPPAGIDFWLAMWPLLPEKTVLACVGGHGRTGTALASLMIAAGVDYYSALSDVRKEHCEKAVETLGQEQYLHAIYLEYLNKAMAIAKEADDVAEMKDIAEDIEYALKNKPSYKQTTTYYDTKKDDKKSEGNNQSIIPFKVNGKDGLSSNVKEDMIDKHTKLVGDTIFVEVCTDPTCIIESCTEPDHLAWKRWDDVEAW